MSSQKQGWTSLLKREGVDLVNDNYSWRGHSFRCQGQWRRLLQSGQTQRDVVFPTHRSLSRYGMSPRGNVEQVSPFLIATPEGTLLHMSF